MRQHIVFFVFFLITTECGTPLGWAKKNKSVKIYSASILCGALLHKDYWNSFIFSQKLVLRVSQGGSIFKKVDFQDVPNYPMWVL